MSATTSLNSQVATAIRVELARQNISQNTFAALVGLSRSGFSRRMTGEIPFSADEIERVAQELGISLVELAWPVQR